MRPAPLLAAGLLSLAGAGCYEVPDTQGFPGDQIVKLGLPPGKTYSADGFTVIDFTVIVDVDTAAGVPITVQVSSGVISQSATPSSSDARTLTIKNLDTGTLPLTLRVGNVAGPLIVTANAGGYTTTGRINLQPSRPTKVVLGAAQHTLTADGMTGVDVTASLLATDGEHQVSLGAGVHFDVCCVGQGGAATSCSGPPPLFVPSDAVLVTGQSVQVRAVSNRILTTDVGGTTPIQALLVAQAVTGDAPAAACSPIPDGTPYGQLSLALLPLAP